MNGLAINKLNETVYVECYNMQDKMTRRAALEKYYEGMKCSEGAEHERYETIFFQLLEGYTECSDQIPLYSIGL